VRVAVTRDRPQQQALDGDADRGDADRREEQALPEAEMVRDRIAEVSAEHIEGGVSEVHDPHHAEDQRQARRDHE